MAKDTGEKDTGRKAGERTEEVGTLLREELLRRGMSEAEIDAVLRKRKRREALALGAVRIPLHGMEPSRDPVHDIVTVEFAANLMQLHPKTILRFIHEGRLKATRVGKSYRIARRDLDAFAGAPPRNETPEAWVTSIIDIPGVGPELAQTWSKTIAGALNAKPAANPPLRAEVIHAPERAHLKIVVTGGPSDTVNLLGLIRVWIEQLR